MLVLREKLQAFCITARHSKKYFPIEDSSKPLMMGLRHKYKNYMDLEFYL